MNKKKCYWLLAVILLVLVTVIGITCLKSKPYLNSIFYNPQPTISAGFSENKVTVSGYVISGGDTMPEGLMDTPRKFVYVVKKDDSSLINVSYTAYPPSSVGDREIKKIRLSFYKGAIGIGDYLIAEGSYDRKSNTLNIAKEGDYIETHSKKP